MDKNSSLNMLCDANLYLDAFNKCKKGSIWKESVQRYEMNLLKNIEYQTTAIQNGTYKQLPFNEFPLCERGKAREIKAIHIEDRVVLRNLCDNILTPNIEKYLIYDNGASVKGKGIHFTRRRFETHLHKYYRKHGSNEGYILLMDFTKFFDNIQHDKLVSEYEQRIHDKDLIEFLRKAKEYLKQLLHEINEICDEYGIFINHKKTQIVKLTKTFTFLKTRYNLTDTGKVIKRINKDSITRERRKLKKFRKMLEEGKMTYPEIEEAYRSWRGNLRYYSAYNVMKNMDKLFNELFIKPFIEGRDFYGY